MTKMTDERLLELLEMFTHSYMINESYETMKPYYMQFMHDCLLRKVQDELDVEEVFLNTILSRFTNYSEDAIHSFNQRKLRARRPEPRWLNF